MRRLDVLLLTLVVSVVPLATPVHASPPIGASDPESVTERREVFEPDGRIQQRIITRQRGAVRPPGAAAAPTVVTVQDNGPVGRRVDLVFVGDGYTANELSTFDRHVRDMVSAMFTVEPFAAYRGLFNIWRVDLASAESGVDNDPKLGVSRDTALDMGFHCGGIARLLCVDEAKARQVAAAAPAADVVVALANSSTWGGAGGGVATAAGGHAQTSRIVLHELGHTVGGLADEYVDATLCGTGTTEPTEPNASRKDNALMTAAQTKWFRWLGAPSPDGGTVDTYEGGRYCSTGIFRPSSNSIMRTSTRDFNAPGREEMIIAFYGWASTIRSVTPAGGTASHTATLRVDTTGVPGTPDIRWRIDGNLVASGATSLNLATRVLSPGSHTVTVTVTDTTGGVRRPTTHLTDTATWTVTVPPLVITSWHCDSDDSAIICDVEHAGGTAPIAIRWTVAGRHIAEFDGRPSLFRGCQAPGQVAVTVRLTDASGASVSESDSVPCIGNGN